MVMESATSSFVSSNGMRHLCVCTVPFVSRDGRCDAFLAHKRNTQRSVFCCICTCSALLRHACCMRLPLPRHVARA